MFRSLRLLRCLPILWRRPQCRSRKIPICSTSAFHQSAKMQVDQLPAVRDEEIRVNLYPEDEDPYLVQIYESASIQQVFDAFKSIPEDQFSVRHSAQAITTLWDIQKFIFSVGHIFLPSMEFSNKLDYIKTLREEPVFQQIALHIYENSAELEDGALASSLLCLKRFVGIRHQYSQKLVSDILLRKSSLSLPALSRLCVTMQRESIYGFVVISEVLPSLSSKLESMDTEDDLRLMTIALRCSLPCLSIAFIQKYHDGLRKLLQSEGASEVSAATLCKVIAFLNEINLSASYYRVDKEFGVLHSSCLLELIRKACDLLVPKIGDVDEVNLLCLSHVLDYKYGTTSFLEAINQRAAELAEQNSSIDVVSRIQPTSMAQKVKLGEHLNQFLDECNYFVYASQHVFRLFKKVQYNPELFYKCWSKVYEVLKDPETIYVDPVLRLTYDLDDPDLEIDLNEDDLTLGFSHSSSIHKRRVIEYSRIYLHFQNGAYRACSHQEYEHYTSKFILQLLEDYENGTTVLVTRDYAKCVAFLLATGHRNIKLKPTFFRNFNPTDLLLVTKGSKAAKFRDYDIAMSLSKQSQLILQQDLSTQDYLTLAKVNLSLQKSFDPSPVFAECMKKAVSRSGGDDSIKNPREANDLLSVCLSSDYCIPEALDQVGRLICSYELDISPKIAANYLAATFKFSHDSGVGIDESARILMRNFNGSVPAIIVNAAMALCYHDRLDDEFISRIFCVDFLDVVDNFIKAANFRSMLPKKLRSLFMQLNRAVCIDRPEANIPWFHERYCEELAAVEGDEEPLTYLHEEVGQVLDRILGSKYYERRVYSPYYYPIDFTLELNEYGQPIKVGSDSSQGKVHSKIAIIVQNPKDYTNNVRRLKGKSVMQRRHLEIMGYRVISVDPIKWNSMHMSETIAKNEYLQSCIFNR